MRVVQNDVPSVRQHQKEVYLSSKRNWIPSMQICTRHCSFFVLMFSYEKNRQMDPIYGGLNEYMIMALTLRVLLKAVRNKRRRSYFLISPSNDATKFGS